MLQSDCAPSILITFINMMLLSYGEDKTKPPNEECKTVFMYGDIEGNTQVSFKLKRFEIHLLKRFYLTENGSNRLCCYRPSVGPSVVVWIASWIQNETEEDAQ